jgi:hypothetical protein
MTDAPSDDDKRRDEIVRRMIATPPKPKPQPKRESNPPKSKKPAG